MKVNELRIGNYYLDIDDKISEMSGHELYLMSIKENLDNLGVNEYRGIPLTEEYLLKFGFYWDKKKVYLCLNKTAFRIRYSRNQLTLFQSSQYLTIPDIKYLHQLQNLYFALTQEELEINFDN